MFVTLGQLAQATQAQSPTFWSDQAAAVVAPADAKQWPALVIAAADLIVRSTRASAFPVTAAAARVQAAAKNLSDGKGSVEDLDAAIKAMVTIAQREDMSTVPDRIRNEEVLDKRLDEFERNFGEWQKAHTGVMALWDKLRGGADLSPFQTTLEDIKSKIDLVPLEGRQRLLERHARLAAGIKPGDWKVLVATGLGALALNAIISKGGSLAASGAAVVATKAKKRYAKPTDEKKSKKKRKRKKPADE
jgi:hypothetical protein